jgi:hypothetical protein
LWQNLEKVEVISRWFVGMWTLSWVLKHFDKQAESKASQLRRAMCITGQGTPDCPKQGKASEGHTDKDRK